MINKTIKIVLLPLDERPCNITYPTKLFFTKDMQIVTPPILGNKKTPADYDVIADFLLDKGKDADGLVLSTDMLLYGGLVPSRLHMFPIAQLMLRIDVLRQLRKINPKLKIYAFQCIMRCPSYSSSDEEPDYYKEYGKQIHQLGICRHRLQNGEDDDALMALEALLTEEIPTAIIKDYVQRRHTNLQCNLNMLTLVMQGVIDFMITAQDDCAPLGFTAMDQEKVRDIVRNEHLQNKVFTYPGADEIALTLLARMRNDFSGRCPLVFVQYAATEAPLIIPLFEDRALGETIKFHIMAAGCHIVYSEKDADLILGITAPAEFMVDSSLQPCHSNAYDVKRNLTQFVFELDYYIKKGKAVTIADNAYSNGGDLELLSMLNEQKMLLDLAGYAGWNTSSNSIGTALAQGVQYLYYGADDRNNDFLLLRYLEDFGYDGIVRKQISETMLASLGMNYFDVQEQNGKVSELVKSQLEQFAIDSMPSISKQIKIEKVKMPWCRMFETEIFSSLE